MVRKYRFGNPIQTEAVVVEIPEETNTYGIPLNAGPVFEFNIDSIVEKNNMKKITLKTSKKMNTKETNNYTKKVLMSV